MSELIYFFSKRTFGPLTRVQSDRGTEFKRAVKTFLKRSDIQNIESRPYHPQSQGKHERSHCTRKKQKETWYIKWLTWYNSFINKLMNLGCIDKSNYKSITPQDHVNISKFYKTLSVNCGIWFIFWMLIFWIAYLNYSENIEGNNLCDMPCYTLTRNSLVYYLKLLWIQDLTPSQIE